MKVKNLIIITTLLIMQLFTISCNNSVIEKFNIDFEFTKAPLQPERLVVKNNGFEMFIDENTTQVKVLQTGSSNEWRTNPLNIDKDSIASPENKDKLRSQFSIEYVDNNDKISYMNNYTDSIAKGQYNIEYDNNGVTVTYVLGLIEKQSLLPVAVSKEYMENNILSKITDTLDKNIFLKDYKLYTYSDIKSETKKKELLEKYPKFKDIEIYELNTDMASYLLEDAQRIIESISFKENQLTTIYNEIGYVIKETVQKVFRIPIRYQLSEQGINITIKTDSISYDTEYFKLTKINLLEYFGAIKKDTDGYIFYPEGCGGIIKIDNQQISQFPYTKQIYGKDISDGYTPEENQERIMLPVFGTKNGNTGFLGIVEKGDAAGYITADVCNRISEYGNVFCGFNLINSDSFGLEMQKNKVINLYQPKPLSSDIAVRYILLSGNVDYSSMAEYYRKYLQDNKLLNDKIEVENLPFYLNVMGGVKKTKSFFGINVSYTETLTTFNQTNKLVQQLTQDGIDNLQILYTGWQKGGLSSDQLYDSNVDEKIAGSLDINNLNEQITKKGARLSFGYDLTHTLGGNFIDFNKGKDSVSYISGQVFFDRKTQLAYGIYDIDAPKAYYINQFKQRQLISEINNDNQNKSIYLQNFGTTLFSHYKRGNFQNREQAKTFILDTMEQYMKKRDVIINGANMYMLKYSTDIINMPLPQYLNGVIEKQVPFYQMVVDNIVNYSTLQLNDYGLSDRYYLLKCIETGTAPYYTWIYENNSKFKETEYNDYYSSNYIPWINLAVKNYKELKKAMDSTMEARMTRHTELEKNIFRSEYNNGVKVYVNYNEYEVVADNLKIEPMGYFIVQGGKDVDQ